MHKYANELNFFSGSQWCMVSFSKSIMQLSRYDTSVDERAEAPFFSLHLDYNTFSALLEKKLTFCQWKINPSLSRVPPIGSFKLHLLYHHHNHWQSRMTWNTLQIYPNKQVDRKILPSKAYFSTLKL